MAGNTCVRCIATARAAPCSAQGCDILCCPPILLPAVAEKEGAALGEHGSGGDSNGGMQRLPTLEWPARQGARGSSPAPPAPSVHTAAATLGRQFSFGLPLASLNVPAGAALADNLAGSGSAELFGPSVPMRIADAVGAKRPAPAAGWQAGVAAGAGDGGSPSKRARPEAVPAPAPAHDPMAAPPTPRTASLQSMLGVLRQAAGMQPVEEQQREVDRHQLLRLLVASVGGGGGAGPTAQPPTPPPTNQAAGGLEALLRAGPWAQQAQQAPAQAPALPMQQLSQLLGGGEGSGSQALAQLALIKQLHQIQQAQQAQQQMQQAQQVQQAQQQMQQAQQAQQQAHQAQQQMQQMQQTQQAQAMAFQGFQAAPQQAVQAPQQAQQVAPQQAAAGQSVPEPVAMLYLQRIAKKLGEPAATRRKCLDVRACDSAALGSRACTAGRCCRLMYAAWHQARQSMAAFQADGPRLLPLRSTCRLQH